jgi:hypothetical protein
MNSTQPIGAARRWGTYIAAVDCAFRSLNKSFTMHKRYNLNKTGNLTFLLHLWYVKDTL